MVDFFFEEPSDFLGVLGLGQNPHELAGGGREGHIVGFHEPPGFLGHLPHFVDGHVGPLQGNLGGHDHDLALADDLRYSLAEVAGLIGRQAAYPEGFDDDGPVVLGHFDQAPGLHGRDELDQTHLLQKVVLEGNLAANPVLVVNVEEDVGILDGRNKGEVDGDKGVVGLGPLLLGPGPADDLAVEDQVDPVSPVVRGKEQAVVEVGPGVGRVQVDGLLGARQDDGLGGILDQVREGGRRIGHGVRPMADDEAVIVLVGRFNGAGHLDPVLGLNVGGVQVDELDGGDVNEVTRLGHKGEEVPG